MGDRNHEYVYLIRFTLGDEVRYKIGYSQRPQRRVTDFSTPGTLELVDQYLHHQAAKLERRMHERLSHRRDGRSEWFNLTERDVASFERAIHEEIQLLTPPKSEPEKQEPPARRIVSYNESTGFWLMIADGKNDYDPLDLPPSEELISAMVNVLLAAAKKRGAFPASYPP